MHLLASLLTITVIPGPTNQVQDPAIVAAEASFQAGDLAGAAKQCRAILSGQPDRADALHLLGKVTFIAAKSIGEFSKSLQAYGESEWAFRRLLQIAPQRDETRIEQTLAVCAQQRGASLQAMTYAKRATILGPRNSNAFRLLGECSSDLGQTAEAIEALLTSLEIDPTNVDVVWLLANEYNKAKKPHMAIALISKTLANYSLDSKSSTTLYQLLYDSHLASNDSISALSAIENVVRIDAKNARGAIEYASSLYRLGRFEEARKAALHARSLQVMDSTLLAIIALKLGQLLMHEQKYPEAIAELRISLQEDPTDLSALQSLAGALRRVGEEEQARSILKHYRQVRTARENLEKNQILYRSQPQNQSAQEKIIRALITLGRLDEAGKQLELRQRKFPDNPSQSELIRLMAESKSK